MTELQKQFIKSFGKIKNDLRFSFKIYTAAKNDETRQKIIDGIEDGTLKTESDINSMLNINE